MLARATAATPWGIEAKSVHVEVDVRLGMPQFHLVGLADVAVRESRERVRSAIKNCGFDLPPRSVVINLAPADLRKEGNHLDLAIALALLAASGQLPQKTLEGRLMCGELGLDGRVRPVRGGLAIASLARAIGSRELLVPQENAVEASALGGLDVLAVPSLSDAVEHLVGTRTIEPTRYPDSRAAPVRPVQDFSDIRGQEGAKRALEIAAAGGHNVLLIGPPGCGKTMLASRLPGILSPLSRSEAIAITKIHSRASEPSPDGLIHERPFRSPHTSISTAGMIGGGTVVRPGEVSLAHGGVLFLDELPEFRRDTLEGLRQPLEDGHVTIVRVRSRFTFPARFSLLAAMNPCKCGYLGDPRHGCSCSSIQVEHYRNRISGPLLDRIDLQVEVPALEYQELSGECGECSRTIAARVELARQRQLQRFPSSTPTRTNAAMSLHDLDRYCTLDRAGTRLMERVFNQMGLSARALHRIRKVARTIADLAGEEKVATQHLAEAIQYRALDRAFEC